MKTQVSSSYYFHKKYAPVERFINYYYQISFISELKPQSILFIGIGDGVVPDFLRRQNYQIFTFDFDFELKPDFVGDIRNDLAQFKDKQFDLVCIFEVLEHIPYQDAEEVLSQIKRISNGAIISVPHRRIGFEFVFKFPFIRSLLKKEFLRLAIRFPIKFKGIKESGSHYWEIDGYTTPLKKFRNSLKKHFVIQKEFTPLLDMYRRFFILK